MKRSEIHKKLMQLQIMQSFEPELRNQLAALIQVVSEPRKVPQGGIWIRQGEHEPNKGYILLEGEVAITKPDAPEIVCQAPELLGEAQQFTPGHVRTASVTATKDSTVLRFSWEDFWEKAAELLEKEDREHIRESLKNLAWQHFAGQG